MLAAKCKGVIIKSFNRSLMMWAVVRWALGDGR
jgi:hypothetical protein